MSGVSEQGSLLVSSSLDEAITMDLYFLSFGMFRVFFAAATCFSETTSKSTGARARDGGGCARGRDSYGR